MANWMAEADRYEQGELSEREATAARVSACKFLDARKSDASKAELEGMLVIMSRLWPDEDRAHWDNEGEEFIYKCIEAGLDYTLLIELLHEHFPSAFVRNPWWRFW